MQSFGEMMEAIARTNYPVEKRGHVAIYMGPSRGFEYPKTGYWRDGEKWQYFK